MTSMSDNTNKTIILGAVLIAATLVGSTLATSFFQPVRAGIGGIGDVIITPGTCFFGSEPGLFGIIEH